MASKYIQIIGIVIMVVTTVLLAIYLLYGQAPILERMNFIVVAVWPGGFGLFLFIMADEIEKYLP